MDRAFSSGASASAPAAPASPSIGYPTSGNPGTGTPATRPGPYWYHMITQELRALIVDAGLTPDQNNLSQVSQAVHLLATSSQVTAKKVISGSYAISPQTVFIRRNSDAMPTMLDGDILFDLSIVATVTGLNFTARTGLMPSTSYTSNISTVTVSGASTAPVSISSGEWSKSTDGGSTWSAWSTTAGTVATGNLLRVRNTSSITAGVSVSSTLTVGTASATFTITVAVNAELFAGVSGAYTGGTLFDVYTAGGGTVTLNGVGGAVITSTTSSPGAIMLRKSAFSVATVKKYRRRFNLTSISGSVVFGTFRNTTGVKSDLTPVANATWDTKNKVSLRITDTGNVFGRDVPGTGYWEYNQSTGTWGSGAGTSLYAFSLGVTYIAEIESDGSNMRISIYDANDILLSQTAWTAWANFQAPTATTYIGFGDYVTDFFTEVSTTTAYLET